MLLKDLIEKLKQYDENLNVDLNLNYCESPELFTFKLDEISDNTLLITQGCCGL